MAKTVWTIGDLLQWTTDFFNRRQVDEPRLSAEMLLSHALGSTRMGLYTQYERVPEEKQITAFRELVKLRAEQTPVAYLIGKAWFFSLEFQVTRDVLIPRPDTETLVEQVIQRVRQAPGMEAPAILDLCTGSGCIAVCLAKNLPQAQITATDLSDKALTVAAANAQSHKVADRISFLSGDLLAPLETRMPPPRFHVIASNPPYIATGEIAGLMATVRDHEPRLALDGGPDGLDFYRRILADASTYLLPGGLLICEMAYNQGPALQTLFTQCGYLDKIQILRDAAGQQRCLLGFRL